MPRPRLHAFIDLLEVPARPFARCLARLRPRGWNTTEIATIMMCMMALGPIGVACAVAGIDLYGGSEWRYAGLVILPMILIGVAGEVLVHRLARRMDAAVRPSALDWWLFWGAPALGPVVFLACTA